MQAKREGVDACLQTSPPNALPAQVFGQRRHRGVARRGPRGRALVRLVEPDLRGVEVADRLLQQLEAGGRRGRAVLGLRDGAGEPLQLLGTGGVPGPRRLRLAREPDEALPAVRDRLGGGGELVLRGLERALRTGPILDGLPLHVLGGGQRLAELPLLRLGALCGRLERVRVLAGRRLPRRVGEVPRPLLGQRDRAAEAFGQGREPVPDLLRRLQFGARLLQCTLGVVACGHRGGQIVLDTRAQLDRLPLVPGVVRDRRGKLSDVVGEQPHAGVPEVDLDARRPPGDRRLPAQRSELPADLAGEVGQPSEVRLHRVEPPLGLLPPLAVLAHPGGLLDEGAAVLGPGGEHSVELALADDHVHLAADAGVGQQILDVEQTAGASR